MNGFANSLLTLLLGWMRVLFSALLTLPQRGSAFLAWLGRHWIPLVLVIVLAALFVDALIYILRWRPQYVWSTRLQRLFHRKEFLRDEEEFQKGFTDSLPNFNFSDTPIQDLSMQEPIPEEYYAPATQQPVEEQIPETIAPIRNYPEYEARNRRSDRHGRRARRSNMPRFRLQDIGASEHNLRYPEPPVQARDAFHAPVYPGAVPDDADDRITNEQ
ncbi:MAG: hypothetical protein IKR36_00785 [Clostridia bacterium]|nr:hypothetical protein [Clostridia bacterium]